MYSKHMIMNKRHFAPTVLGTKLNICYKYSAATQLFVNKEADEGTLGID